MAVRLADETRRPDLPTSRYAFMAAREVFELPALWQRIDALDGKVKGEAQLRLYQATQDLVNAQTLWFLRDGTPLRISPAPSPGIRRACQHSLQSLNDVLPPRRRAKLEQEALSGSAKRGIPADLAADVAGSRSWGWRRRSPRSPATTGHPVPETARVYLEIGEQLRIADSCRQGPRHRHARPLRPPGHRPGAEPARRRPGRLHARRHRRRRLGRPGVPSRASSLAACRRRWRRSPARARLTVSRLLVAAGQLSDLAATGRSFSISQEGPSSGSGQIRSQRKPARS